MLLADLLGHAAAHLRRDTGIVEQGGLSIRIRIEPLKHYLSMGTRGRERAGISIRVERTPS